MPVSWDIFADAMRHSRTVSNNTSHSRKQIAQPFTQTEIHLRVFELELPHWHPLFIDRVYTNIRTIPAHIYTHHDLYAKQSRRPKMLEIFLKNLVKICQLSHRSRREELKMHSLSSSYVPVFYLQRFLSFAPLAPLPPGGGARPFLPPLRSGSRGRP